MCNANTLGDTISLNYNRIDGINMNGARTSIMINSIRTSIRTYTLTNIIMIKAKTDARTNARMDNTETNIKTINDDKPRGIENKIAIITNKI